MTDDETTPLAKLLDFNARMFDDLRGDLRTIKQAMDTRFDAVDARFEGVDRRLDAMDAKLDARFDTVDERFVGLEARQEEEGARARAFEDMIAYAMSGMRVDVMQLNGRLERLEAAVRKAP